MRLPSSPGRLLRKADHFAHFVGGYHEYFGDNVDDEAVVYLMLVRS